jgi:hypothetical protein
MHNKELKRLGEAIAKAFAHGNRVYNNGTPEDENSEYVMPINYFAEGAAVAMGPTRIVLDALVDALVEMRAKLPERGSPHSHQEQGEEKE